jgi:hypothetical protein
MNALDARPSSLDFPFSLPVFHLPRRRRSLQFLPTCHFRTFYKLPPAAIASTLDPSTPRCSPSRRLPSHFPTFYFSPAPLLGGALCYEFVTIEMMTFSMRTGNISAVQKTNPRIKSPQPSFYHYSEPARPKKDQIKKQKTKILLAINQTNP